VNYSRTLQPQDDSRDDRVRRALDHVLVVEGWPTYTNNPDDRGGPTKGGITLQTLRDYTGDESKSAEDLQDLSLATAEDIYKTRYIRPVSRLNVSESLFGLFLLLVDCSVLHGPTRAVRWLQAIVGETEDGVLGPKTALATYKLDPDLLVLKISAERWRFTGRLVTSKPSQATFAHGWANRMSEFIEKSADELEVKLASLNNILDGL